MAVFKCKMCGGDLNIEEGMTVAECAYCGTKQTIPLADDEKKLNLFNRANRLRRTNEFDKAASLYESIIAEFPEESEAYWGLCLCNYGIEYVDDPLTKKKIPTCHRASFESLQKDENFKLALEYGNISAQAVLRTEAREIDRIMEEILSVSRNEKPYDVFICYKEKDENGSRTPDSVIAQDIYDVLTEKGLKVFFSRISLEDKLGTAYEPYIFAALNSSKVMLAVGTKFEYFNAVWVKNEWSRFLKLMQKDKSKVLIPCFKDMDAYDIPEEFSHLQAQDMGKIGFMQDLVRGVKKIAGTEDAPVVKEVIREVPQNTAAVGTDSLLERAFMFLEDQKWQEADTYCEKVLDIDPKNARAYLGKLMADLHISQKESLKNCAMPFDNYDNYNKVMRFGDKELTDEISGYSAFINDRNETARKEKIYREATARMNARLQREEQYIEASKMFLSISDYKDSKELGEKCTVLIEKLAEKKKETAYQNALLYMNVHNSYELARDEFKKIPGYKDADEKYKECERLAEEYFEKVTKRSDKRLIIFAASVCTGILLIMAFAVGSSIFG